MTLAKPNADQEEFWDADAGPIWVRNMGAMDLCLAPVLDLVLDAAALLSGETVLDVGCGAGTSVFAAARKVAPGGSVTGVDISATLLAQARSLATDGATAFVDADAQTYAFEPGAYDVMISRFGVMFFDDPVTAFRNMASALKPGGRMVFAAWGAIPANPYFTLPAGVAKSVLGERPKTDPDAPGPFAFRDTDKVCRILSNAGLRDVRVEVVQTVLMPEGGAEGFADLAMQIGPAPGALAHFNASAAQAQMLRGEIVKAAKTYVRDGEIRLPAEINVFSARVA